MIRRLGPSDVLRQVLPGRLGGEPLASTHDALARAPRPLSPAELLRWAVAPSKDIRALGVLRSGRLAAAAVVRPRSGPRAWEVARLFASEGAVDELEELLEGCVAHVGSRGGERLFLRMPQHGRAPQDGETEGPARRAGFVPAFTEEVFRRHAATVPGSDGPLLGLRPTLPADDYGLFRLYCAALPTEVRAAGGLTFEQWRDARERAAGTVREYVREDGEAVRCWLRLEQASGELIVDAMLHPDEEWAAERLIGDAGLLAWRHARATWIVPSYAPALSAALLRRGWTASERYAMWVRPVALPVREPSLAAARA